MTKRIFRAIFIAAVSVLTACIILIMGFLYSYFNGVRKSELKTELYLTAQAIENQGLSYLNTLGEEKCRLTWIDSDGNVLFDNQSDSRKMENHLEREEVREALETGFGESERYSSTLTEKTVYYAKKLSDNSVIRISVSQLTVLTIFLGTLQPIIIVLIIALIISFVLASGLSKRIIEPMNLLDLDNPLENDSYDELSPFLSRIAHQQKKIQKQKDELNQRKNEFLAITSNMNEGLILLDGNKKIISLNPSAESFLTLETECVGRAFIEIEREHAVTEAVVKAESDGTGEAQLRRNGRTYQLNISCIKDTDILNGFVILILDATEKVSAESRRREFTANVSHELKTPLQSIMGSAELIENGFVKKEDIPRFIGNIRNETARLVTLIDDIIRLSQLDEGVNLPKQEFDLYELAGECIDRLKAPAEKKNVSLFLDGESSVILSVRPLVSEIIFNLIDNAIKYNVDGGSVNVAISGNTVTVADTGIGIPPEHQARVFERFYRVDKSHSKETGGTGLGLAIVRHAAEDIGAKINLKSSADNGTEVTVIF